MNSLYYRFLLGMKIILFLLSPVLSSQKSLPNKWDGIWKGETKLFLKTTGKTESVGVELQIKTLSNRSVKMQRLIYEFADKRREERNYEIKSADDSDAGHFIIDEKNGFLLDNYLVENSLYSQFTINGNLVTTMFRLQGEEINMEMMMFDLKNPRHTKLTGGNFEVDALKLKSIHRGILKKVKPSVK